MSAHSSDATIRAIFKLGEQERFGKGDLVFGMEPTPKGIYYIESGFVVFYSITVGGEKNVLVILGPGEVFPFAWAYVGVQSDTYGEALGNTVVWRISRDRFTVFAQNNARGAYALGHQMAKQFQVYIGRLKNLEYKHSSERVAYRLLFLADRFGKRHDGNIIIDTPITQELLAQTINLTRESVSREVSRLEQANILGHKGRRIVIKDTEALSKQLGEPWKCMIRWQ